MSSFFKVSVGVIVLAGLAGCGGSGGSSSSKGPSAPTYDQLQRQAEKISNDVRGSKDTPYRLLPARGTASYSGVAMLAVGDGQGDALGRMTAKADFATDTLRGQATDFVATPEANDKVTGTVTFSGRYPVATSRADLKVNGKTQKVDGQGLYAFSAGKSGGTSDAARTRYMAVKTEGYMSNGKPVYFVGIGKR